MTNSSQGGSPAKKALLGTLLVVGATSVTVGLVLIWNYSQRAAELTSRIEALGGAVGDNGFDELTRVTFNIIGRQPTLGDANLCELAPLLGRVTALDLSETLVTDESLLCLKPLASLRVLCLRRLPVHDAAVLDLARGLKLEALDLRSTLITQSALRGLAEVPTLKVVYVCRELVPGVGKAELREWLPHAEIQVDEAEPGLCGSNGANIPQEPVGASADDSQVVDPH